MLKRSIYVRTTQQTVWIGQQRGQCVGWQSSGAFCYWGMENRDDIALSWETAEVESGKAPAGWCRQGLLILRVLLQQALKPPDISFHMLGSFRVENVWHATGPGLNFIKKFNVLARDITLRLWLRGIPLKARYLRSGFCLLKEQREKHHYLVF